MTHHLRIVTEGWGSVQPEDEGHTPPLQDDAWQCQLCGNWQPLPVTKCAGCGQVPRVLPAAVVKPRMES